MRVKTQSYYFYRQLIGLGILYLALLPAYASKHIYNFPSDTTSKPRVNWKINKDSAACMSEYLLNNHPAFKNNWINEETFVFEETSLDELPDEIVLPLLVNSDQFNLTWYGKINSTYKKRWGKQHHGIDIHLKTGDSVVAAFDGVVRYAQYNKAGFGNCVVIRHLNGLETIYGHMSKLLVTPNEYVSSGQLIGLGGSTGHSFGPHLHFETRYKDFSFDPEYFIDVNTQQLKTDTLILHKNDFTAYRYKNSGRSKTTSNINAEINSEVTLTDSTRTADNTYATINQSSDPKLDSTNQDDKITLNLTAKKTKNNSPNIKAIRNKKELVKSSNKKAEKKGRDGKANNYTIKPGDNLTVIAKKTGVPIAKLRKLNVIKSDFKLMPGQKLRLH